MGNVLSAKIVADGGQFTKTMGQLQDQLKRFEGALKTAGNTESFNRLQRAIDETKRRIDGLKNPGNPLKPVVAGANEAQQSLINLGRVVQDAPFGFLGIANNLNPLQESFSRTAGAAGGFGNAMKAIGKGLIGPGGIGLAISAISTALVVFGDKIFGAGKAFSQAEIDMANFKISLDKLNDSLETFKNNIEFGTEFDRLKQEVRGIEGIELSLFDANRIKSDNQQIIDDNKKTIEKLNKQFDEAFSKLGTGKAFDLVSLFTSDLATIPDSLIQELSKSDEVIVTTIRETTKKIQELQKDNVKRLSEFSLQDLTITKLNNEKRKKELEKSQKDFEEFANKRIKTAKDLASFLDKTTIREFDFEVDPTKSLLQNLRSAESFIQKALDLSERRDFKIKANLLPEFNIKFKGVSVALAGKEFVDRTFASIADTKTFDQLQKSFETGIQKAAENAFKAVQDRFKAFSRSQILEMGGTVRINPEFDGLSFKEAIKKATQQMNTSFIDIIRSFQENVFNAVGEGIGQALSGGGFSSLFKGVFNAVGSALQQLGQALIGTAIGLKAIKAAFKTLNPAVALGAGIGLIALGAAIKNTIGNISGFRAEGGPVQAGKRYVVGEKGPELFVPNTAGRIVPNNQLGTGRMASMSAQGVFITGEFVQRGNDLVAVVNAVNRSQNRTT